MVPPFDIRVLAETERFVTLVDECGVTKRMLRADYERSGGRKAAAGATSSMSQWIDFPVKDPRSWATILEERFRPTAGGRIPAGWTRERRTFRERAVSRWVTSFPFPFGGLFSVVRELMGPEGALFALSDEPALVRAIVGDLCRSPTG